MEISAAVVRSFDHPPRYESFDLPAPADEDAVVLDVLAVGLHPRVRTGASGRHYTSTGELPMVPGVDGVGYLWGKPAASAIPALLFAREDRSRELNWIQIGAMAGPTIELPSVALRSANFRLQGNGQGAVSTRAYLEELPPLVEEIDHGGIAVTARALPLADVESVWTTPEVPGVRTVLVTGEV